MLHAKVIPVLVLAAVTGLVAAPRGAAAPSASAAQFVTPYTAGLAFTPGVWVGTGTISGSDTGTKLRMLHQGAVEFKFQVGKTGQILGNYSFQMKSYASGLFGGTVGSGGYAKVADYSYPHAVSVSGTWSQDGELKASKGGTTVSVPLHRAGSLGQVLIPRSASCTQLSGVLPTAVGNSLRVRWTARVSGRPAIPGKAWFDAMRERITTAIGHEYTGGRNRAVLGSYFKWIKEYNVMLAAAKQCKRVPPGHADGLGEDVASVFGSMLEKWAAADWDARRVGVYDIVDIADVAVSIGAVRPALATLLNSAISHVVAEFPGVPEQKAAFRAIADTASQAGFQTIANRARTLGS
jgi:hypothetical protein